MKPHSFMFRGLMLAAFVSGIAMPVSAQIQEQWVAHNGRVARVRAELTNLEATGPMTNWTLADWMRLPWLRAPGEDISDNDMNRLEAEIAKEKTQRARMARQHDETQDIINNRQRGGSSTQNFPLSAPDRPMGPDLGR